MQLARGNIKGVAKSWIIITKEHSVTYLSIRRREFVIVLIVNCKIRERNQVNELRELII